MPPLQYVFRLLRSVLWQRPLRFEPPCEVDLSSHFALVTGGNAGIGLETVRGLATRGATVLIGSRDLKKAQHAVQELQHRSGGDLKIHVVKLDLADLVSVKECVAQVQAFLNGKKLDILVNNAGILPTTYSTSRQGHELSFATNHLGPFLLTQLLLPNIKRPGGRVVFVNAELHTLVSDASPDFMYSGSDGQPAYRRSKLASIWCAYELQRRHPELVVPVLHPGVIDSGMFEGNPRLVQLIMRRFIISTQQGAMTTLYCCIAHGVKGLTYYHNCLGNVPSSEISYDTKKAAAMWELSSNLTANFQS